MPENDSTDSERLRLQTVFWNSLGPGSVAHALTELLENMPAGLVDRRLWSLGPDPLRHRPYVTPALPKIVFRALCKARVPASLQGRLARHVVLRSVRPGDVIYMWPPYDLELISRAQDSGATVVAERTNCMATMGREVLLRAYGRRGLPLPKGWFPAKDIAEEREQMLQCNFVTAPNPLVSQSLLESGLPEAKILETFYGFSPVRLAKAIGIDRPERRPVFAFVGHGIVRKGLDVLLEAWEQAAPDGTLLLAGPIDDELRSAYASTLARPDVTELGYVKDIASVYAAADAFVFPTHEEGGPQVIYEAAGCGLPSIVSRMGAGRIVRHGIECLMIDPLCVDGLAAALTRLAEDQPLRRELGIAATKRAREFTWAKAGMHLYRTFCAIADIQAGAADDDLARMANEQDRDQNFA
jgi:glycosyltransferase involved in cell wall biosynthesis